MQNQNLLTLVYKHDLNALHFFSNYRLKNKALLPLKFVEQYTINASVLKACIELEKTFTLRHDDGKIKNLNKIVLLFNNYLFAVYGFRHDLPTTLKWFRLTLKEFLNDGANFNYGSLVSGKLCNQNSKRKFV